MTTPSFFSTLGLSLNISDPIWWDNRVYQQRITDVVANYSHLISAGIGFDSASMSFQAQPYEVDDWIANGIARDVQVKNYGLGTVWEGFVNKVSINIGSLSVSRGPLLDIGNRVMVMYTPIIDAGVDPMVTGSATETPIAEDTDSQDKYGIIEKILSGGQLLDDGTTDEAEELRDLFLAETKEPFTDESLNIGSSVDPTITIECLGYYYWMTVYVYNFYTATTVTVDTKVIDILDAEPNSIISTDQTGIDANAQLTNRLEDKNRFAGTILQDLTGLGDGSDNRWLFNVLEDRKPFFYAIPSEVEYYHRITEPSQKVYTPNNDPVEPWDVRPAKWLTVSDFLIGRGTYDSLRQDPRTMFIESVNFTAPYNVALTGSRVGKLSQRLKQLGAGGG